MPLPGARDCGETAARVVACDRRGGARAGAYTLALIKTLPSFSPELQNTSFKNVAVSKYKKASTSNISLKSLLRIKYVYRRKNHSENISDFRFLASSPREE